MNKYVIIGLIVVLAIILFLLLKTFVPSVRKALENSPKWLMFLLIAIVIVIIVLLVRYLVRSGGMIGTEGQTVVSDVEKEREKTAEAELENCVIVRADKIYIKGQPQELDRVEDYLESRAKAGATVTLVDDYSLASLYRTVIRLCDDKGVNYNTQDESWLEEQ